MTSISRFSTSSFNSSNKETARPSSSLCLTTETKKARSTRLGFSLTSNTGFDQADDNLENESGSISQKGDRPATKKLLVRREAKFSMFD
jgi:hypothetical protein